MTAVKICGICTPDHASAAATAGADLIGLVFAPSRRQISPAQAVPIIAAIRQHPRRVRVVGLFVNTPAAEINALAAELGLDYIQLSGDEVPQQVSPLTLPVLPTVRLQDSPHDQAWLAHYARQCRTDSYLPNAVPDDVRPPVFRLLVDAHVVGHYGGTGTRADWDAAAALAARVPLLLAGGLTPDNVSDAIRRVRPWGVDVSSGVEQDGQKDPQRMAAFVQAVRRVI